MGLVVEVKSVDSPKAKHLERLLNGEMEFFYQIVIFHYRKDYSNCEMPLPLATVVLRFVSTWLYLPGFSWSYLFIYLCLNKLPKKIGHCSYQCQSYSLRNKVVVSRATLIL